MKILSLHGNHYQMGLQHGKQVNDLRPLILATMDARLEELTRKVGRDPASLDELECAWDAEPHARSTVMMLEGMAQALDIPNKRLFQYAAASYLQDLWQAQLQAEGCTVWAASRSATRDGAPILGKNRDYDARHIPLRAIAYAAPRDSYRYIYVTSAGSPCVFSSGMNECGLVIADTHVPSRDIGPGLARFTLMMNVLEQCASAADTLAYLKSVRCMGAGNLVLVDSQGVSAVFENGYRRSGLVPPVDDLVVATNHFVSVELRESHVLNMNARDANDETHARYEMASALLRQARGTLDAQQAKRILSYHGQTALCRHRPLNSADTISASIYLPARRQLLFCSGWPCQGSYETYTL